MQLNTIPRAPRVPSDLVILMTYVAPQSRVQANRVAATAAAELGVTLDGATSADELS